MRWRSEEKPLGLESVEVETVKRMGKNNHLWFSPCRIISYWTCTWPRMSKPCTARSGTEPSFRSGDANVLWPIQCKTLALSVLKSASAFQYFSPYVSADMTKMAQAFNTTVAALEDELTQLILEGLINARIDSHSKVTLVEVMRLSPGCFPPARFALTCDFLWRVARSCTRGTWTSGAPRLRSRCTWAKSSKDEPKQWSSELLCCATKSTLRYLNELHVNFAPYFTLTFLIFKGHVLRCEHSGKSLKSFRKCMHKKKKKEV